jgi:hypothetical protein
LKIRQWTFAEVTNQSIYELVLGEYHGLARNGCLFVTQESRRPIFENPKRSSRNETQARWLLVGMGC